MNGKIRRNAVRRYVRSYVTGFFLGVICVMLFFCLAGTYRTSISAILDETTWLWIFGIGAFASLLIPQTVVQLLAVRDRWLYCPHCGNFIASIRALIKLNKQSRCDHCGHEIEIAPINKQQSQFDMIYFLGGTLTLIGLILIIRQIIG